MGQLQRRAVAFPGDQRDQGADQRSSGPWPASPSVTSASGALRGGRRAGPALGAAVAGYELAQQPGQLRDLGGAKSFGRRFPPRAR